MTTRSEVSGAVLTQLAPAGVLRATVNFGNAILAQRDRGDGQPGGVSLDLARTVAEELAVDVAFISCNNAGDAVDAVTKGQADLCFLAIEPARAETIAFTEPYVLIQSTYLVADGSAFRSVGDLDRPGLRILVNPRSAYDLYLTRTLEHAQLVRSGEGYLDPAVMATVDATGGIRQMLAAFAASHPQFRILPDSFGTIRQAIGVAQGKPEAAAYLVDFIRRMKANGRVAEGLERSGQDLGLLAPPQDD